MIPATTTRPDWSSGRHCRVLMTTDALGGVWRYSIDLSRALRERGVDVSLAVIGPPPTRAMRDEAADAGATLFEHSGRLEWMDDAADDVARTGRWLLSLAERVTPDLVHLNNYSHAALPWLVPVLVVAHSCLRSWWKAVRGAKAPSQFDGYTRAVTRGLRSASHVVVPSHAMREALCHEYRLALETTVIPNGCSVRRERPAHKVPIVLAAGRLWDEAKNVTALNTVAPRLAWPVYVAGDARFESTEAGPLPAVRMLGHLPARALRAWYARAAIFALPERYDPCGLAVLEAARYGCALVLGDIPSLRENWDGAAKFVPPDDHRALARALRLLIERPTHRGALAGRAFERSRRFTVSQMADSYLRVYEGLLP